MAKSTYQAVGNKEDISALITNISPKETPFYAMCGTAKATATYHEHLEDSLREPTGNAKVEGAEFTVKTPEPRVRLGNYTQIFSNGYGVTATQEVVLKHGVTTEIGYQMRKAMKETALDIEHALITQTTREAGSSTAPRRLGGVPFWITTNRDAVSGAFTEEKLNDALQKCWQVGGNPTKVFLSGAQKRNVSAWTGKGDAYVEQNSKKLVNSIAVYESDFGIVSFVPHKMMPNNTAFVIDTQYWKVAYLRKLKTHDLPKTGDSHKKVIVGELTMEARAEKASAILTNLTV